MPISHLRCVREWAFRGRGRWGSYSGMESSFWRCRFRARRLIVESVPECLKIGVQAGIGFFIVFIGLRNAGLVVDDPGTLVSLGDLRSPASWLALVGIALTGVLLIRGIAGGVLLAILTISLIGTLVPVGES